MSSYTLTYTYIMQSTDTSTQEYNTHPDSSVANPVEDEAQLR